MIAPPYTPTPAYVLPRSARVAHEALCSRGHRVLKRGICSLCGLHRPKRGGWGIPCKGVR